jgi:leader peptidase (prepilin peptidase)/N-methyltransferase
VVYLLSFFYGAALGSFVNVIVQRLHIAPILNGRSKCLSCGEKINWFDLIPVVSYLVLRGRCRSCKHRFGIENLIVEILYGAVFVLVYGMVLSGLGIGVQSIGWLAYYSVLFVSLGVMALYDMKHTYIPLGFFGVFFAICLLMMGMKLSHEVSLDTLLGPVAVALPFLLIYLVTRGKALGFGDVLMYTAVGAFFGVAQGLAVLLLSVWLGALVGGVLHIAQRKKYSLTSGIPFIPFIACVFVVVLFTDIDVFSIVTLLHS